jgi:carboxypeptidase T
MKSFLPSLICVLSLSSTISYAEGKVIIRLRPAQHGFQLQRIPGSIDVAGQNMNEGFLDIVGSPEYFDALKEEGFNVEIIAQQTPSVDPRYLTPEKITAFVQELKSNYPEIVHVVEIGKTIQGRPLLAVRISSPDNLDFKPTILFNGMHHARELMTTEVTTDIMTYLVSHYDDPETPWVTAWIKNLAIWILPQVNPDGNAIVWSEDSWWRKNSHADDGEIYGVDINRNYPYMWGRCKGSSGSKSSQTYRGETAGSEPETQAVMNFVREQNFAFDITYHSYSELVIAPYGCQNQFTPENAIVQKVGGDVARVLRKDDGSGSYTFGNSWQIIYPVDGDDVSWMYNQVNTMAFVVEINSADQGFQPDYSAWRDKSVQTQRAGWQHMLNRLLTGPQVRGRMLDAKTGQPIDGFVSIEGVKYKDEKPRTAKRGAYQKILIPGNYDLIFSAPGYQSQTLSIAVDEGSVISQDVYFVADAALGNF